MTARLLLLAALALLPSCQRAESADACNVLKNPSAYEGKRLRLAGSVWMQPDGRPYFNACLPPDVHRMAVVWRTNVGWTPPTGDVAPILFVTAIVERDSNGWRLDGIGYEDAAFFDYAH